MGMKQDGIQVDEFFLVGFGDTSQSDSHHPAGKTWGRESATINEDSIGYFEAFPCPVTVSKRFSYYTDPPKWCTMKSRFIFLIKGLRQFGNTQETLDYKARPSSLTVAISGCHTSHITISRCALFLAQRREVFFACASLWIGIGKRSKSVVLQMVLQNVFFLLFWQGTPQFIAPFFAPEQHFLHFLIQHP